MKTEMFLFEENNNAQTQQASNCSADVFALSSQIRATSPSQGNTVAFCFMVLLGTSSTAFSRCILNRDSHIQSIRTLLYSVLVAFVCICWYVLRHACVFKITIQIYFAKCCVTPEMTRIGTHHTSTSMMNRKRENRRSHTTNPLSINHLRHHHTHPLLHRKPVLRSTTNAKEAPLNR